MSQKSICKINDLSVKLNYLIIILNKMIVVLNVHILGKYTNQKNIIKNKKYQKN